MNEPMSVNADSTPIPAGQWRFAAFEWYGELSGRAYHEVLLKEILPQLKGEIEVVLVWEGGDSLSGLRAKDGAVKEMYVGFVLKERV